MMKLISLLSNILFTVVATTVNNTIAAQPQNDRLDSLKREYSYKICKEYIDNDLKKHTEIIPIVQHFPCYYEKMDTSNCYILPNYTIFSYNYGGGLDIKVSASNIYNALKNCRMTLDSLTIDICRILINDSIYRDVVHKINSNSIDYNIGIEILSEVEQRIRKQYTTYKYTTRRRNQWTDRSPTGYLYVPNIPRTTYSSYSTGGTINYGASGGMTKVYIPNNSSIPIKPIINSRQTVSYITNYTSCLYKSNLASLRVILDDHIRRGVPIDISWIPEQTLADIEATKPVRQLKKQIKTLEKQQKQ